MGVVAEGREVAYPHDAEPARHVYPFPLRNVEDVRRDNVVRREHGRTRRKLFERGEKFVMRKGGCKSRCMAAEFRHLLLEGVEALAFPFSAEPANKEERAVSARVHVARDRAAHLVAVAQDVGDALWPCLRFVWMERDRRRQ